MTFRKNSIMFIEHVCVICIMATVCIVLSLLTQEREIVLLALCLIMFAALMPIIHNEFITINNEGIRCTRKEKVLWEYTWEEIIKLKRSSRYRMPSVEIVIDDHADEIVPYDYSIHYFQLGKTAHKAITQYYQSKF